MKTADFAAHLTEFLSHYLPELKNISTNTISSYCDAFRLFLGYCQDVEGMRIEKLSIDDLTPELVDHFLQWLRIERNNGTATRSQRLAAIRSFVKYLQIKEPRLLLNFQQILAIPVKRAERKAINPLTKEAIALILRQPDTSTLSGRRDATILCFLYDTAARVQEICDLRIEDVRLDYPASVKILGKGRKTRVVPILPATAQNLKKYLTEMHMLAPEKSHLPLFMNRNGQKLTRAGVTYILNKYAKAASVIDPSIPEKIPPHLMRHTIVLHQHIFQHRQATAGLTQGEQDRRRDIGEVILIICLANGDLAGVLIHIAAQLGIGRDIRFLSGPIGDGDRRSAQLLDRQISASTLVLVAFVAATAGISQGQKHLTDMGSQLREQLDILHRGHFGLRQDDRAVQRG